MFIPFLHGPFIVSVFAWNLSSFVSLVMAIIRQTSSTTSRRLGSRLRSRSSRILPSQSSSISHLIIIIITPKEEKFVDTPSQKKKIISFLQNNHFSARKSFSGCLVYMIFVCSEKSL
jgi:hypothetical protein